MTHDCAIIKLLIHNEKNCFFLFIYGKQSEKQNVFYKRVLYNGSVIFLFHTVNGFV